jgi:hypothetical protein
VWLDKPSGIPWWWCWYWWIYYIQSWNKLLILYWHLAECHSEEEIKLYGNLMCNMYGNYLLLGW